MPSKNLVIGFSAVALVLGAVGAVASGIDWDPRDVEASERYRESERERADRYRNDLEGSRSRPEFAREREVRSLSRQQRRDERREARRRWWDETTEDVAGAFGAEGLSGWLAAWQAWWADVAPRVEDWEGFENWEEWARRQEARVADPSDHAGTRERAQHPAESRAARPSELPAAVERILEDSLAPERREAVRRGTEHALDWWAEERERMRHRYGAGEGR